MNNMRYSLGGFMLLVTITSCIKDYSDNDAEIYQLYYPGKIESWYYSFDISKEERANEYYYEKGRREVNITKKYLENINEFDAIVIDSLSLYAYRNYSDTTKNITLIDSIVRQQPIKVRIMHGLIEVIGEDPNRGVGQEISSIFSGMLIRKEIIRNEQYLGETRYSAEINGDHFNAKYIQDYGMVGLTMNYSNKQGWYILDSVKFTD